MKLTTTTLTRPDGIQISVRIASPSDGPVQRQVLWIHGICEHSGRYDSVLELWTSRGWQIIFPDHRGHGQSTGLRTDCVSINDYLQDLHSVIAELHLNVSQLLIFGHSFGGLLAMRGVQTSLWKPAGVILSAPLLGVSVPVPFWKRALGHLVRLVRPTTRFATTISPDKLTSDPAEQQRRRTDPLIQRSVTARWFFAMEDALKQVWHDANLFDVPVLVVQGTADVVVDPNAIAPWLALINTQNQTFRLLHGRRHELLHEPDWSETAAEIFGWTTQLPAAGQITPAGLTP